AHAEQDPAHTRSVTEEPLLLRVLVDDLALGGLLEGHRQVVLRAGLDQRRGELVERPLAELMVVVVDLPRALGGDDHERVARVDLVQQLVDAGMDHGRTMVAAPSKFRATIAASSSAARSLSSLRTTKSNRPCCSSWRRAVAIRPSITPLDSVARPRRRRSISATG